MIIIWMVVKLSEEIKQLEEIEKFYKRANLYKKIQVIKEKEEGYLNLCLKD